MANALEYKIREGDTLETIAKAHYGISNLNCQLKSYNKLADNLLEVGKIIRLPQRVYYLQGTESRTNRLYLDIGQAILQTVEIRALLLDDLLQPMKGSAWKAQETLPGSGTTGDDGVAVFEVASNTTQVTISWWLNGNEHTATFWVEIPDNPESATRRRLDNLGFSTSTDDLEADINDFQRKFGQDETGTISDILNDLHDDHKYK